MKRFLFSLLAVGIAIAGVAFTTPNKAQPTYADLVWFNIPSSTNCNQLDTDDFPTSTYATTASVPASANHPGGCVINPDVCCAKGYQRSDLVNVNGFWVPRTNTPLPTPTIVYYP